MCFGAIAVSAAMAVAALNVAYAYSIYPFDGATGASGAAGSTPSTSDEFGSSINQLIVPFENFVNSVQSIQPADIPSFNNITNQIPSTGILPSLQSIIIKAIGVFSWIIGWLEEVSSWIAAWVVSIIR
jgi:hypothetical protein